MVLQARGSAGWTLVESLFVVAAVAVGLGLAVPSYQSAVERREAVSAAEQFSDFVAHARQLAVTQNRTVTVGVQARDGRDWCVGAAAGRRPCDCSGDGATACRVGPIHHAMSALDFGGVTMESLGGDLAYAIDPATGYKAAGDLGGDHRFRFTAGSGRVATEVAVSPTGLATVCVPDGANTIGGFYRCARDADDGGGGALTR